MHQKQLMIVLVIPIDLIVVYSQYHLCGANYITILFLFFKYGKDIKIFILYICLGCFNFITWCTIFILNTFTIFFLCLFNTWYQFNFYLFHTYPTNTNTFFDNHFHYNLHLNCTLLMYIYHKMYCHALFHNISFSANILLIIRLTNWIFYEHCISFSSKLQRNNCSLASGHSSDITHSSSVNFSLFYQCLFHPLSLSLQSNSVNNSNTIYCERLML